jgi:hypothetical protein
MARKSMEMRLIDFGKKKDRGFRDMWSQKKFVVVFGRRSLQPFPLARSSLRPNLLDSDVDSEQLYHTPVPYRGWKPSFS